MILLATLLGALLAAAVPGPGEPTFSRAELSPDGLCFDSPVDLDWEAMARREFKAFALDNPPEGELRSRLTEMHVATFTFATDLPADIVRRHFYLVAETGPRPIVPQKLLGSIHYRFHPPAGPGPAEFTGRICLPAPEGIHDAGFVAASSVPLSWRQTPAALVQSGSATRVRLPSGSAALPPPGFDSGAIEVKTAYILSSAELADKYVFVRRKAECPSVCCEFTYDIYRWEPGLPVVASNSYGCDI